VNFFQRIRAAFLQAAEVDPRPTRRRRARRSRTGFVQQWRESAADLAPPPRPQSSTEPSVDRPGLVFPHNPTGRLPRRAGSRDDLFRGL
jgi:hypothetical protein